MASDGHISFRFLRRELATIDSRLKRLEQDARRIREESARLQIQRSVLVDLQEKASVETREKPHAKAPKAASKNAAGRIPDGRVATPIIYDMIRQRPGITSVEIMDVLEPRVTTDRKESPRKFLADLIWELGHRNRLRREDDGGLFLVESPAQGGAS